MLPEFLQKSAKERHLLVFDYSPHLSRVAYFNEEDGDLIFRGNAEGVTVDEAYAALPHTPTQVSEIILGVPFQSEVDTSTVVRFRRDDPQTKITEDEVTDALSQIPPAEGYDKPFFEDLFNAKIDGLPTLQPIGRLGEVISLNYFQAYDHAVHLEAFAKLVEDYGPKPGLVPTAYAIAKLVNQTNHLGAVVLDVDSNRTEVSLVADGHLVGIKPFDVGGDQKDFFTTALEAALEEMDYEDPWPEQIFLTGSVSNYEQIRSELLAYPWTKKTNMMGFPKIEVYRPSSVNLSLPTEVGVNALSLLG